MIRNYLKEYKKQARKKSFNKFRVHKNHEWRKRWLPFIKYDHDFDSSFFLELIVYKLHMLLDFHENNCNYNGSDNNHLRILVSLKEACRIGDLLIDDRFEDPVWKFYREHTKNFTKEVEPKHFQLIECWDDPINGKIYVEMMKDARKEREKTKQKFFKYLADHFEEWWD